MGTKVIKSDVVAGMYPAGTLLKVEVRDWKVEYDENYEMLRNEDDSVVRHETVERWLLTVERFSKPGGWLWLRVYGSERKDAELWKPDNYDSRYGYNAPSKPSTEASSRDRLQTVDSEDEAQAIRNEMDERKAARLQAEQKRQAEKDEKAQAQQVWREQRKREAVAAQGDWKARLQTFGTLNGYDYMSVTLRNERGNEGMYVLIQNEEQDFWRDGTKIALSVASQVIRKDSDRTYTPSWSSHSAVYGKTFEEAMEELIYMEW